MMLNTDLHNKNVRADKKMKVGDFIRNLRGRSNNMSSVRQIDLSILKRYACSQMQWLRFWALLYNVFQLCNH